MSYASVPPSSPLARRATAGVAASPSPDRELGRVLLLSGEDKPLDAVSPLALGGEPERIARHARAVRARIVLLDLTRVPFADSDGLRWILHLKNALDEALPQCSLRVAAPLHGKVRRNLDLLGAGVALYDNVRAAWHPATRLKQQTG